jgi:glycerophosphoryl diester phosphodiesterase
LYAWTVDDPADMRRLVDDKVDGIISNRPDVLRRVLDRRPTSTVVILHFVPTS